MESIIWMRVQPIRCLIEDANLPSVGLQVERSKIRGLNQELRSKRAVCEL